MTAPAFAFRMPAEWEPHDATWIGWPHELKDWPGRFAPIPWAYGELVRLLSRHERVRILVGDRVRLELSQVDAGRGRIVEKI